MTPLARRSVAVDGTELSFLHAGSGPPLVLLHGTWWSRVWAPVLPALALEHEVLALDLPGFGRSAGRLTPEQATVPALARWVVRFADAVGIDAPFAVGGHDIGGGIAQHLAVHEPGRTDRLVLVNSVLFDSWPVPAVERFRDPEVAATTTVDAFVEQRGASLDKGVARPLDAATRDEYLAPLRSEDRMRSWMAMAASADARYTLDLVDGLRERALPTLLAWGADDEFQPLRFAERYADAMPAAELVRIDGARHLPTEDRPDVVADGISTFLGG